MTFFVNSPLILPDDPKLFGAQPVCLQVIGRPFQDEELISAMEALDLILNPKDLNSVAFKSILKPNSST